MGRSMHPASLGSSIIRFLEKKGTKGATLSEIYKGVREDISQTARDSSIRNALYIRLEDHKGNYTPRFQRFTVGGRIRYRILVRALKDKH